MPLTRTSLRIVAVVIVLASAGFGYVLYEFVGKRERHLPMVVPAAVPEELSAAPYAVLATGLEIPWSLDFLPDERIVVTERPGRVRLLTPQQGLLPEPLLVVEEVVHRGEGGLLGVAVHPEFEHNRLIYLYYTYQGAQGLANKVVAYALQGESLTEPRTVIEGIPGAPTHNGGRIRFGPDGMLYVATGDAEAPRLSQEVTSLAGKILRLRDNGTIPTDNPFADSPVYSYGHRNPQGLAWDDEGNLWSSEHGARGHDEINRIEAGRNYGWPVIQGNEEAQGMERPVLHSGTDTWAPSGADVLGGTMYFAGLRGRALYAFNLDPDDPQLRSYLEGDFGRLRDVVRGPQGRLYLLTSNRDGRGVPTGRDDLLVVIDPARL